MMSHMGVEGCRGWGREREREREREAEVRGGDVKRARGKERERRSWTEREVKSEREGGLRTGLSCQTVWNRAEWTKPVLV